MEWMGMLIVSFNCGNAYGRDINSLSITG